MSTAGRRLGRKLATLSSASDKKQVVKKDKPVKSNAAATATKRKRGGGKASNAATEDSPYFQKADSLQPGARLPRSFYEQDTVTLAKALLGTVLCRKIPSTGEIVKGTVVETEAYPGKGDAASKSSKGVPTQGNMAMFMDPGTAYVYMTYGMYYCFNVSAKDEGGACLFRGLEVDEDYEIMQALRQPKKKKSEANSTDDKPVKRFKQHELANGPSKLCAALNMTRDLCDKIDMTTSNELWLEVNTEEKYHQRQFEVEVSGRVGIESTPPEARNQLYRFYIKDNPSVSKAKFPSDGSGKGKGKKSVRKRK